jgi:hypothetical protein
VRRVGIAILCLTTLAESADCSVELGVWPSEQPVLAQENLQRVQAGYAAFDRGITLRSWKPSPKMSSGCYLVPLTYPSSEHFVAERGVQEWLGKMGGECAVPRI